MKKEMREVFVVNGTPFFDESKAEEYQNSLDIQAAKEELEELLTRSSTYGRISVNDLIDDIMTNSDYAEQLRDCLNIILGDTQ